MEKLKIGDRIEFADLKGKWRVDGAIFDYVKCYRMHIKKTYSAFMHEVIERKPTTTNCIVDLNKKQIFYDVIPAQNIFTRAELLRTKLLKAEPDMSEQDIFARVERLTAQEFLDFINSENKREDFFIKKILRLKILSINGHSAAVVL